MQRKSCSCTLAAVSLLLLLTAGLTYPTSALPPARDPAAVRLNKVIALFESGRPAFGIFVSDPTPRKAVQLAASPLDFVVVDMEHAPLAFDRLEAFLAAFVDRRRLATKGNLQPDVIPIVRLAPYGREMVHFTIKQALDLGAYGLMLPFIETPEQALSAIRAARYPQPRGAADREPIGQRGAAYGFAARLWGLSPAEYERRADIWPLDRQGEVLLMLQIESVTGVKNIERILDVPGVSSIFIGPSDLAFSLGVPPGHPDHERAIQTVLAACKKRNIPCGITASEADVRARLRQGFRFVTVGGDDALSEGTMRALRAGRQADR